MARWCRRTNSILFDMRALGSRWTLLLLEKCLSCRSSHDTEILQVHVMGPTFCDSSILKFCNVTLNIDIFGCIELIEATGVPACVTARREGKVKECLKCILFHKSRWHCNLLRTYCLIFIKSTTLRKNET